MTRTKAIKLFKLGFLCMFVGSLIVWSLPISLKPYHFKKFLTDYKTELVEQDSQWGFDSDGLVKVKFSHQYRGTSAGLNQMRQYFYDVEMHARNRWPTDSRRPHYDEWGPSNWYRPDGLHEVEVGTVYCIPYSLIALISLIPLLWWSLEFLMEVIWKKRRLA